MPRLRVLDAYTSGLVVTDTTEHESRDTRRLAAIAHGLIDAGRIGGGIYLGRGPTGWVFAPPQRSLLVLGPSRAGKTSSIVIPNVLVAPGPVVVTSTKDDVMVATAGARAAVGWTLSFCPSTTNPLAPGVLRAGWSPVNGARNFDRSLSRSRAMVETALGRRPGQVGALDHWQERSAALLAPLLHAAELGGLGVDSVLRWVDRHDPSEALSILRSGVGGSPRAHDMLAGIVATDPRERSGIFSSAAGMLAPYRSDAALEAARPPFFDADAFVRGANTLYIAANGPDQAMVAPMVVGLLHDIRDAAYRAHESEAGAANTLFCLDELAHIAPLPDLGSLVAEGGGRGVTTIGCLQDLSQGRARWGTEGDALLSLFSSTLVLPGIADLPTLRALSLLAGDARVVERSVTSGHRPDRTGYSTTTSSALRARLAPDEVARGRPGMALGLDPRNRLGWVSLTPAHRDAPFASVLGAARDLGRSTPGWDR